MQTYYLVTLYSMVSSPVLDFVTRLPLQTRPGAPPLPSILASELSPNLGRPRLAHGLANAVAAQLDRAVGFARVVWSAPGQRLSTEGGGAQGGLRCVRRG